MRETYSPEAVESEVQAAWKAKDVYRAVENALDANGKPKPKFYVVSMLPYPSGKLHMGHVRNYTLNDVMYRYYRMRGYNVMTPMGWDSFGLPAENAALAKKVQPAQWTYSNIADMKKQMEPLGLAFDWSREVTTCKPEYYRWNQWIFLQMLKRGIAYRKTQIVNWDPVDKTVLANEQVIDGRGWRSGALVEKREIPGYYLAITKYAQELLDDLKTLDWPEQVLRMQEHWIGRSEGVDFAFPYEIDGDKKLLRVYTTRPETIMGVTFVAIAAEHPLAAKLAQKKPELQAFIDECAKGSVSEADMATMEKKGVPTGFYVTHPLTGKPAEVWIANYVLMSYGEGAVMGVPSHDERDFAFAKKFNLPIVPVLTAPGKTYSTDAWQDWYGEKLDGMTLINSGKYDGMERHQAIDAIAADLEKMGLGSKKVQFRLRDWGISRQRYWGTPIPMINCPHCGAVPVPEEDLPVVLPENLVPDGSGNPLNKCEEFLNVKCPKCGGPAKRETDTMDTFVDSSWYFQRYCSPDCTTGMIDKRADYWMPMDQYIGGIEHAVLHLLYARFWTKVMRDLGLVKYDEPFKRLFTQGMLMAESYFRVEPDGHKRWFYPDEVEVRYDEKGRPVGAICKADGEPVELGGIEKMSKSKCNVVEPRDIVKKFGADTARSFVMFAGPPNQSAVWSNSGAEGTYRFLRRVWNWAYAKQALLKGAGRFDAAKLSREQKHLRREIHSLLKQADYDMQRMQYNTVVSACMKMLNALEQYAGTSDTDAAVLRECASILIRTLYPIAPHITTALWHELGYADESGNLLDAPWPKVDEAAIEADEIKLVVQVNGKLRGQILVEPSATQQEIEAAALANPDVKRFTDGKTVRKVIVVKNRLVNVVAA
ncbi:MAG: Leucine--tRNA ligase [Burkholderia sp.]|jgi:leucyl-tRNA synthetase